MGGGGRFLYTIKTSYKIFNIRFFYHTKIQIKQIQQKPHFYALTGEEDFCNIGKYIAKSTDKEAKIQALIEGLSPKNQSFVLRQIALCQKAYLNNDSIVILSKKESKKLAKINAEFSSNIFKFGENLYAYKGYLLPINHFEMGVFYHKHSLKILEKSTLETMRQKDFIDVGGFIGDSAIIFEREFCDKNIYSFEATKTNFTLMQKTLKLNNSSRIVPINKALGAKNSTMPIHICSSGSSMMNFAHCKGVDEIENAQIITLDDFVRENKLEIGFIKVDIEGFEMEFLKGAKESICTQKPAMLISIYHQGSDYFGIKPLIESWNLGYNFKIYKGIDGHILVETALYCEIL